MTARDRIGRLARWVFGPRGLMAFAVSLLFFLMAVSFVNIDWGLPAEKCEGALCEVPVTGARGSGSIAEALFGGYSLLIILIALVLAACMIGGVYLAKAEGGGPR